MTKLAHPVLPYFILCALALNLALALAPTPTPGVALIFVQGTDNKSKIKSKSKSKNLDYEHVREKVRKIRMSHKIDKPTGAPEVVPESGHVRCLFMRPFGNWGSPIRR